MEIGIIIDQSHGDAMTLDKRIIDMALEWGYELDEHFPYDQGDLSDGDYADMLREYADESVDYMNNKIAGDGKYFIVDDNSLYLTDETEG